MDSPRSKDLLIENSEDLFWLKIAFSVIRDFAWKCQTTTTNGAEKKWQVHTCTTCKRIGLEGPGWSGFQFATNPDQPRLSSLICLEVIKDKRKIPVQFI